MPGPAYQAALRLALATLVLAAAPAQAQADAPAAEIWFDIPAESLVDAIAEYSRQAHVSVGSAATHLSQLDSHALRGFFTPGAALTVLLSGTGLKARFIAPDAAVVSEPPPRAAAATPPAPAEKDTVTLPGAPAIENMVVTATKATSRAQTLPAAVSVVDGRRLEVQGVTRAGQLISHISGLMTTNVGPGRSKLFIRGLSDGAFTGQTRSTVGVYLDEAPMTFNDPYPDLRLVDIDRIEVLRGPQGTLYGTGAVGGVLRVIPNMPDLEDASAALSASGSVTHGGGLNQTVAGYMNLPLADDRLGLRLAGSAEHDDGYIDDRRLGRTNVNSSHIGALRGILRWQLAPDWTLDLTGTVQKISLDDTQYFVAALGRYNRDNYLAEPYSDFFKLGNAKLTGEFGGLTLMSSTTLVRRENRARNDATLAVAQYIDAPLTPSPFDMKRDIDSFSQEVRLASQEGPVEWLAGLFYLRRSEGGGNTLTVPGAAPATPDLPQGVIFQETRSDHVREAAAFTNVSVDLGSNIRLTAGARLFRSNYVTKARLSGPADIGNEVVSESNTHTGVVPQTTLSYRPNDALTVYAGISAGYRNGGINVNTPLRAFTGLDEGNNDDNHEVFRSDRLWNLELGVKREWLDHRLRLNADVFYVFWENVQTDQYLENGLPFVLNAGDARNYGLEMEVDALVGGGLEIGGNIFWNSPELSEGNSFLGADKGDRLPGIAEFAAGMSATYRFRLGGLNGTLSGRYTYMGKSYLMFGDASPSMGEYHMADLRAEVGRDRWSLGLFMQNSWSQTGNSFSFGNPFSRAFETQVTPLQPLTIGLTAQVSY